MSDLTPSQGEMTPARAKTRTSEALTGPTMVTGGSVSDLARSDPIAAAIFDHVRGGGEAPGTVTLTVS